MKMSAHLRLGALLAFAVGCGSQSNALSESLGETQEALRTGNDMLKAAPNDEGKHQTATVSGTLDDTGAYFQTLGVNDRTCQTCHISEQGWSISPKGLRKQFEETDGTAAIFKTHDTANAPNADVSTVEARRAAYSLLLSRGTIRFGFPVRNTHQFKLVAVDDPYGFISAPPAAGPQPATAPLSLYRRPIPTMNFKFATVLNWDGRANQAAPTNIALALFNQANGATGAHALLPAATPLSAAVRNDIVAFETSLFTAQTSTQGVGDLDAKGGGGGPEALINQSFTYGANDPTQPGFTRKVFTLYDAWVGEPSGRGDVADGQRVFNEKEFAGGRTCTGCHSLPNIGSSSGFRFFDVGISSASRRAPDMPLYTLEKTAPADPANGDNVPAGTLIQTTDPGRALFSGRWADINRFKAPGLRGLASHAPFFHDGSAKDIEAVVDHYEAQFNIVWEGNEKKNLIKFLASL